MTPCLRDCLEYGMYGACCQQVFLVCAASGSKISVGVSFISLFSKYLSRLIAESQAVLSDVPTIVIPVQYHILEKLIKFLSEGEVILTSADDAFAVGEAADILGFSCEDWTVENNFFRDPLATIDRQYDSRKITVTGLKIENASSISSSISELKEVKMASADGLQCDICDKSYRSKGSVIAHKLFYHSGPSPAVVQECPICKKIVSHVTKISHVHYLGAHIDQHIIMNRRQFFCDLCPNSFIKRSHLIRHIKNRHEAVQKQKGHREKVFPCIICGKSYTTRGTLIAHNLMKHTESTNICKKCPICKKTVPHVKNVVDLGAHIDFHFKKQCDMCEKSFATKSHLLRHKKTQHKA